MFDPWTSPEQEARERLADEVAHDVVDPPEDLDDVDGVLAYAALAVAYGAAYAAILIGGTVEDARAAAAERLRDLGLRREGETCRG